MRRFAVLGLVAAAALIAPPAGTAAAAETVPAAGEVDVYLAGPGYNPRHYLTLHLYPLRGIALVQTVQGEQLAEGRFLSDSYAIAIPKGTFEGPIDLSFPGVGEVVGTVVSDEPIPPELPAKVCSYRSPGRSATFEGRIVFHGLDGHASWSGRKALASIAPECGPPSHPKDKAAALFGALSEFGPVLPGPAGFAFFAHALSPTRYLEFVAFGDDRVGDGPGTFAAIDKEWLPGEVATQRVVNLSTKQFARSVMGGPGGDHPARVDFAPPAPFFGHATYRRQTGKLRGTLGVRFLGLTLRLTARPLIAKLYDEEPTRARTSDRAADPTSSKTPTSSPCSSIRCAGSQSPRLPLGPRRRQPVRRSS